MEVKLVRSHQELPDVWSFFFSRPPGYRYEAGDYAELELFNNEFAGRRWFSLASAPHEPHLQFTVRIPTPHSDFKTHLMKLKPGDTVRVSPAIGNFNLPLKTDKLLFIAGGIGITPFRSMSAHIQKAGLEHDVRLLHVARGDHLFKELFDGAKSDFLDSSSRSRWSPSDIGQIVDDMAERIVYLAGPEIMMSELYENFLAHNHPRHRLKLAYFPGYRSL